MQFALDPFRKFLEPPDDQLKLFLLRLLITLDPDLFPQVGQSFLGPLEPRFELLTIQQAVLVCIHQSGDASLDLRGQGGQLVQTVPSYPFPLRSQPSLVFLLDSIRITQQGTDIPPDGLVQHIGADLVVLADPLPAEAIRIGPDTTVVCVRSLLALAGGDADRLAVEGISTLRADQQPLQKMPRSSRRVLAATLLVLLQLPCHRFK